MTLARLIIGTIVVLAGAAVTAQQPTFSTRTESVRVDALVTENGRIVRGLGPADFEVRDEGVTQRVDFAGFEQMPVSVVLALDASHSVAGEPLRRLQIAAHALVDGLRAGERAAVIAFDHRVWVAQRGTSDIAAVHGVLDRLEAAPIDGPGSTALVDAVYTAMVIGDAAEYRPLVIVFSDGVDTGSWLTNDRAIDAARRLNAVVYAVAAQGAGETEFLKALTNASGGDLLQADAARDLRSAFVRILEEFRGRYVLSYSPTGVSRSGWHPIEVRVKGRRATVKARPGYSN